MFGMLRPLFKSKTLEKKQQQSIKFLLTNCITCPWYAAFDEKHKTIFERIISREIVGIGIIIIIIVPTVSFCQDGAVGGAASNSSSTAGLAAFFFFLRAPLRPRFVPCPAENGGGSFPLDGAVMTPGGRKSPVAEKLNRRRPRVLYTLCRLVDSATRP